MESKTNILWICSDQQRWDTLGCYGNEFVQTPHLDRLAKEGVLFENAFCQSPICTPVGPVSLQGAILGPRAADRMDKRFQKTSDYSPAY